MNMSKLIQLKEAQERRLQEQERRMEYEIFMKDTSNMSEQQCKNHEKFCDHTCNTPFFVNKLKRFLIQKQFQKNDEVFIIK